MSQEKEKSDAEMEEDSTPLLPKDPLMNDSIRFNIVYLLYNFESLGFTPLQKVLKITSGNLDHHLKKLTAAGVVANSIRFSPRPLKILRLTPKGKEIFRDHIQNLKKMIDPL